MNLESELRQALRREEPPAGFTERVILAIGRDDARPRHHYPWRALAAAALFVAIVGGSTAVRAIEERREGERAKEQVLLALRITGAKLHHVHDMTVR